MSNMEPYRIIDATAWPEVADEPQGGKQKVWLREPATGRHWLLKVRSQGGDDWAERVAADLADELGLPGATVELATRAGKPAVLSLDFTNDRRQGELLLGNELLVEADPAYPADGSRYRLTAHTVSRVISVLQGVGVPQNRHVGLKTAAELFVGYLVLDALIGNTDRHHENWGILRLPPPHPSGARLAPTFDHAASLGQILQDEERRRRLETRDIRASVAAYARRARSALYAASDDPRPLGLLDAVVAAEALVSTVKGYWRAAVRAIPAERLALSVGRVPEELLSPWARRFAIALLQANRETLLEVPSP